MDPDTKAAALWSVIGGLSFLVLVFAYRILTSATPDLSVVAIVAVLVAVASGGLSYYVDRRLASNESA